MSEITDCNSHGHLIINGTCVFCDCYVMSLRKSKGKKKVEEIDSDDMDTTVPKITGEFYFCDRCLMKMRHNITEVVLHDQISEQMLLSSHREKENLNPNLMVRVPKKELTSWKI